MQRRWRDVTLAVFIDLPLSDDGSAVDHFLTAFAEIDIR
jgi:hypothetical protein